MLLIHPLKDLFTYIEYIYRMSSFKPRSSRVRYRSDVKTLDEIHTEYLNKFKTQRDGVTQKREEIIAMKIELEELESEGKQYSAEEIKKRAQLKDKINSYERQIKDAEDGFGEMEYFAKTHDVILKYYDITEGKYYNDYTETSDVEEETKPVESVHLKVSDRLRELNEKSNKSRKVKKTVRKRNNNQAKSKSKPILSFLAGGDEESEQPVEEVTSNRATLQDEYLTLIDEGYVCSKMKYNPIKRCTECDVEMTLIQSEGMYVCQECGESNYIIIESEIPSHKDAINEKPKYPYKKINHLIEKLNQFQSKETNNIPDYVFEAVEEEIRKRRIDTSEVTIDFVRRVLKKYRYNKYYENKQYIFSKVTNTPPPILTRDQEEEIKKRFRMLEEPFMRHRPKDRNNFLNYSFVLHKIFKIMGMDNHAKYFTLLKSKDKLKQQDKIWEKICNDLGWPFHSSKTNNRTYMMKF